MNVLHPTMDRCAHRAAPTSRNYPACNVNTRVAKSSIRTSYYATAKTATTTATTSTPAK